MMKRMNADRLERVRLEGANSNLRRWIEESLKELDAKLRVATDVDLYRLQGSAQTLDEILQVFDQSR
jgi:hypothetical protein